MLITPLTFARLSISHLRAPASGGSLNTAQYNYDSLVQKYALHSSKLQAQVIQFSILIKET